MSAHEYAGRCENCERPFSQAAADIGEGLNDDGYCKRCERLLATISGAAGDSSIEEELASLGAGVV